MAFGRALEQWFSSMRINRFTVVSMTLAVLVVFSILIVSATVMTLLYHCRSLLEICKIQVITVTHNYGIEFTFMG